MDQRSRALCENPHPGPKRRAAWAIAAAIGCCGLLLIAACSDQSAGTGADTAAGADTARDGAPFADTDATAPPDAEVASDAAPDAAPEIAGDTATPPDTATTTDTPKPPDAAGACSPCGTGSLKGLVCAPSQQVFVPQAKVTATGVGCDGQPSVSTTTTDQKGFYTFDALPCGQHTIDVAAGSFHTTYTVDVEAGTLSDVTGGGFKLCFKASSVRIAVLSGQWDHMHGLLDELGLLYDFFNLDADDCRPDGDPESSAGLGLLRDPVALAKYDIVFFNCGSAPVDCVDRYPDIKSNLKKFVLDGGSLYGSDRAWAYIEAAFPDAIDFYGTKELTNEVAHACGRSLCGFDTQKFPNGVPVAATVVDGALADYSGVAAFTAFYGPGPLVAIDAAGPVSVVHVSGDVPLDIPQGPFIGYTLDKQPLVVSHRPNPQSGRVVFTTFHNDEQADEVMKRILYYLVFLL
ncbi:MAG: carboxypeptidase-like regulatory domain-containing protein [Myxococcota bacterium]